MPDLRESIIERATAADRDALVALMREQLDEHDIAIDDAALGHAVGGALADASRGLFLVARSEDEIVGVAYLSFTWALEHGGRSAWLEELYVRPERRSGGIGTMLLHAAIVHAIQEGCAAIDLEVDASHARAARLYERQGFSRHRRERWFKKLPKPARPR